MKIFVFGTRGFPGIQGGVEKHCENLYPRFPEGFEITVFRRRPYVTKTARATAYPRVRFIDLPSGKVKGVEALVHSFLCSLVCAVRRPGLVQVHNIGPGLFVPLLRATGLKVVLTYHSANYEHKKWGAGARLLLRLSERVALTFSNRIIFVNQGLLERQTARVRAKSVCIPNGVAGFEYTAEQRAVEALGLVAGRYVLAVGRMTPEKGFDVLVDAYIRSGLADEGWQLALAGGADHGDAYFRSLQAQGRGKVVFAGVCDAATLRQLYSHARLFVLSSYQEGFPLAMLEAMQAGCDLLLSDLPATRWAGLPETCYFKPGDAGGLARSLSRKLSVPARRYRYSLEGYTWEDVQRKTQRVLEEVCCAQKNGSPQSK